MNRAFILALATVCFFAAYLLSRQERSNKQATTMSSLGRSLGGLRVLVEDALYLRASRLRQEGRPYDAAALYNTLIELDPDNDAAMTHLIDVQMGVMLEDVPTPQAKFNLWNDVRIRVAAALKRHPESARLHLRMGELLFRRFLGEDEVNSMMDSEHPHRDDLAFDHVRRSVELRDSLANRGRMHLDLYSAQAPFVALRALQSNRRDAFDDLMASMRDVLKHREHGLSVLKWIPSDAMADNAVGFDLAKLIPMKAVMASTINTLTVLAEGSLPASRKALAAYELLVKPCETVDAMRAYLNSRER